MIFSDFTNQEYEQADFLRLLEHRIRKEIRQHNLIDIKKSYVLEETDSLQSKVLMHFLKQIFSKRLSLEESKDGVNIISTDYLELYVGNRLNVFLNKENPSSLTELSRVPLRCITQHELIEAAKCLFIAGSVTPYSHEIVDALQKKYSQSKPSFLKSFSHIETLTAKK